MFEAWEAAQVMDRNLTADDAGRKDAGNLLARRLSWGPFGTIEYRITQHAPGPMAMGEDMYLLRLDYERHASVIFDVGDTDEMTGRWVPDPEKIIPEGQLAKAARRHVFNTVNARLRNNFHRPDG